MATMFLFHAEYLRATPQLLSRFLPIIWHIIVTASLFLFQWEKDGAMLNMSRDHSTLVSSGLLLLQVNIKIYLISSYVHDPKRDCMYLAKTF